MSRRRRILVWTLVGVTTLIMLVCSLTIWVDRQMLDNNAWNKASEDLIQDKDVRSALSVYLVNQLYENVDVPAALAEKLPANLKPLAAPAAAALRGPAADAVDTMLARPRVQTMFVTASSRAHQRLINVLENKTGYGISTGDGTVTLDLDQLVTQLGTEVGLPQSAIDKIPADAGQITLMQSSQLSAAQQAVNAIRVLSGWLLVLVLALYGTAIYLARGERRRTLRSVSWAFVVVGLLLLVIRKVAGDYVIGAIAAPGYEHTGHHIWLIWTSVLGQLGAALILYGAVALLGVALAGETKVARDFRSAIAPAVRDHMGAIWGGAGIAYVLIVLWGGTHALRTWWGVLLIGALLAAGVEALRRKTLADAAESDVPPQSPHNGGGGAVAQRDRELARSS